MLTSRQSTFMRRIQSRRDKMRRRWDLTGIPCCHVVAVIRDTRNDPEDYVDNCYTVESYLNCYENIIKPINGKTTWPEFAVEYRVPEWSVPHKGRQQKKRRRTTDEDYIQQSQSKSVMRRKGQVVMTCSECGLKGHNKRYHSRADAPINDLFNAELEEVEIDRVNRSTGKKKGKLTPKRSTTSASNQARERESMLQFMPTLGANMQHGDLNVLSGLLASRPVAEGMSRGITEAAVIITEEVDISTMVDELEQLESQEATRNRADRARARTKE
ncbi:Uncharacterized protein Adt_01352 [Abeliophyllum distichum]|uniref:Zinc finger PMZ-type domain-containing protein n=1 Tax=Abeliophyllum distichum TaxID=126358 RepID=A0ABD1VSL3_9LAMI